MPPKAKAKAKAKAKPTNPLKGICIALAVTAVPPGILRGQKYSWISTEVKRLGGKVTASVSPRSGCTHLVATLQQYQNEEGKVKDGKANPAINIVDFDWLDQTLHNEEPMDEAQFLLHQRSSVSTTTAPATSATVVTNQTKSTAAKKRGRSATKDATLDDGDEDDQAPVAKKKAKAAATPKEEDMNDGQLAKSSSIVIPLDEGAPTNCKVHIGSDGMIYDATLNQANSGNNNNKFYRIQILTDAKGGFSCWTRWGRVGERGQSKLMTAPNFDAAFKDFNKKFRDKNGNPWEDRFGDTRAGKYTFLERNYEPDSDDEADKTTKKEKGIKNEKDEDDESEEILSKLQEPVQRLMGLIFNQDYFQQTFAQLNYDAQKMPLGKLSKRTLLRGYDVLKELANLVGSPTATGSIPNKSDQYFSLIPHAFGRDRPPILNSMDMIKREIELLDTLTDMSLANDIIKDAKKNKEQEKLHLYDRQFAGLGMQEMTPLDPKSSEFKELSTYLTKSAGQTHHIKYNVQDIFRIERQGEHDRFNNSQYGQYSNTDRRLLWHGSRCTNYGGILSQGLRIAPPEAPVSGYMFGKGVYLANMSSKSANYCCAYNSGNTGLLLLCEAELGTPPLKLTNADYNAGDQALKQGSISTWGVGMTAPQGWKDAGCVHKSLKGVLMPDVKSKDPGPTNEANAYLMYDEYIVYDVAQIKLRYLLRVQMN